MVRLSLEGVEVAAKITGLAAKEIAVFIAAALKNKESNLKLKGKARLTSMLKSGKPLEIFSLKESDLAKFAQGAKQYGIVYCLLRKKESSPDGLCDVMVKADDCPKISRLIERFKFATVDTAKIESEIEASKSERARIEKLLDDFLGPEEKSRPLSQSGKPQKMNQSEHTSESRSKSERDTSAKPSVKKEIRDIKTAQAAKKATQNIHNQPARVGRKKKKSKIVKENR
jgi:hypothetical protein